jgi:hypothetical protein
MLIFLAFASAASAQSYDTGSVLKWETKTYSQSAHITKNHVVYSVRIGNATYQIARRSDKVEFELNQEIKCRVEKGQMLVLNDKGRETKYDIVGSEPTVDK